MLVTMSTQTCYADTAIHNAVQEQNPFYTPVSSLGMGKDSKIAEYIFHFILYRFVFYNFTFLPKTATET